MAPRELRTGRELGGEGSGSKTRRLNPQFRPSKRGLSWAVIRLWETVGIMDADLQDEPEVLLDMFRLLQSEDLDVV